VHGNGVPLLMPAFHRWACLARPKMPLVDRQSKTVAGLFEQEIGLNSLGTTKDLADGLGKNACWPG
jgi:hypothetical protein